MPLNYVKPSERAKIKKQMTQNVAENVEQLEFSHIIAGRREKQSTTFQKCLAVPYKCKYAPNPKTNNSVPTYVIKINENIHP